MRWLLTLIIGALLGAGALFVYLRQVPHDAPSTVTAGATALPAPVVAPGPNSAAVLNGQLPRAPAVTPDLNETDLPVRPTPAIDVAPVAPGAAPGAGATATAIPAGKLMIPVEGVKQAQLTDTFNAPRGTERQHQALDIMAPKGTKVFAVADGKVAKLFESKPGGLTVYQFDPTDKYAYYYAHLDHYADGLKEGAVLKRGDLVGYVGVTGNSDPNAPHLHFALVQLTPEKQWWKGTPIDPYPLMAD